MLRHKKCECVFGIAIVELLESEETNKRKKRKKRVSSSLDDGTNQLNKLPLQNLYLYY